MNIALGHRRHDTTVFKPDIQKYQLHAAYNTPLAMLAAAAKSIWAMDRPVTAIQLRQLWPSIRQWEMSESSRLCDLLEILHSNKPENPKFRNKDTAAQWAARYFFYRSPENWKVIEVNRQMLPIYISGNSSSTNFHVLYENEVEEGYLYFKYGKDWEKNDKVFALASIRLAHEQSRLFRKPSTKFIYANLLVDNTYVLSDKDFNTWLDEVRPRVDVLIRER